MKNQWKSTQAPLQVVQYNLPSGIGANLKTIQVMQEVARARSGHPLVRECAHSVLISYGVASNDYTTESLAIGDFVKKNVRYVKDADGIEQLTDPLTLIEQISRGVAQGDCDDMSLLVATLLLAIGHTPRFKAVKYDKDIDNYNHIYVVDYVYMPENNYKMTLDAILKNRPMGSEVHYAVGDEYEI